MTERQHKCQVQSVGPGFFHFRCFSEHYPATGRQNPNVVGNTVRSAVTPSCVGPEYQVLGEIVTQVDARCEQPSIQGIVICPCPGYENKLVAPFQGVFPVSSIDTFLAAQVKGFLPAGRPPVCQHLVKILHQGAYTGRDLMMLPEARHEDCVGKKITLQRIEIFQAKVGVLFVQVVIQHHGNIRVNVVVIFYSFCNFFLACCFRSFIFMVVILAVHIFCFLPVSNFLLLSMHG